MSMLPEIKAKIELRLKDLESERQQLLQMLNLVSETTPTANSQPKLADSIKTILMENPPLQLREIFHQLKQLGYVFRGANPKMSVYSAMKRHPETFENTAAGWTLSKSHTKVVSNGSGADGSTDKQSISNSKNSEK